MWLSTFRDSVGRMAVALHYDLDDMEFFIEHQTASEDVDLGWMTIPKDTIAALRAGWNGKVNGQIVVQSNVAWYLTKKLNGDWVFDDDHYHVVIKGRTRRRHPHSRHPARALGQPRMGHHDRDARGQCRRQRRGRPRRHPDAEGRGPPLRAGGHLADGPGQRALTEPPTAAAVPGRPNLLLGAFDVSSLGYVAEEHFMSGTASSFTATSPLGGDGRWEVSPTGFADYTTRIVILRPVDATKFNGTVLVEWLNVSGGIDAPAVWFMAHREMVRGGYAYVAVSAQRVGVEGGPNRGGADMSLKTQDPTRYAALHHPGDAFAYDVFTHAGRMVRDLLGPLSPKYIVALGESQSAMYLTTYVNAIDPLAGVYDGFLVHSRFASAAPLDGSSIFNESSPSLPPAVRFRTDLRVPLITVITETDLLGGPRLGYHQARQPDDDRLRVWEIPGTAHADNYTINVAFIDTGSATLDDLLAAYQPTDLLMGQQLPHCINFAPQHHYVLQAALSRLNDWVTTGAPAPHASSIELTNSVPRAPILDSNGLAEGGIRTPWVDVPLARTSGIGSSEGAMSDLFGSGELFDAATLQGLYPGGLDDYLERFTVALDAAIGSGFILGADHAEIIDIASATYERSTGA